LFLKPCSGENEINKTEVFVKMKKLAAGRIQPRMSFVLRYALNIFSIVSLIAGGMLLPVRTTVNAAGAFEKNGEKIAALDGNGKESGETQTPEAESSPPNDKRQRRATRREKLEKFLRLTNGDKTAARKMLRRDERENRRFPKAGNYPKRSFAADSSFSPASSVDPSFVADLSEEGCHSIRGFDRCARARRF
jgi:hypothetical protein